MHPVGQALVGEHGDKLRAVPESEWLPIARNKAVAMMMEEIKGDLAALNIKHDVFFSERSLIETGNNKVAQTIDFLRGTQQAPHSDAIHFSTMPEGFMCGVWVALEDATSENGPLRYVPGSQRFSEIGLEALGLWGEADTTKLGASYARYEQYLEERIGRLADPLAGEPLAQHRLVSHHRHPSEGRHSR